MIKDRQTLLDGEMTNPQPLGTLETFWGKAIATSWLEVGLLALPSGAVSIEDG